MAVQLPRQTLRIVKTIPPAVQHTRPKLKLSKDKWLYSSLRNYFYECLSYYHPTKATWNSRQYVQLGLLTDDVRMEDKYFLEAVNMLPHDVKVQRDFRIQRAFQLSYLRTTLPKEQWTKLEDDVRYLEPYVQACIAREKKELEWETVAH